jgi:hypothetical protein
MTYLSTAPARCWHCGRVLFTTRAGQWPWHYTTKRDMRERVWCVASGTRAPEVGVRAVVG